MISSTIKFNTNRSTILLTKNTLKPINYINCINSRNGIPPHRNFTSNINNNNDNNNKQQQDNNNSNNNDNNNNKEKEDASTSMSNNRTVTWASLSVALLSGGIGWLYYDHLMTKKRERQNDIKTYGTSSVGGPFALIDENGKPFTNLDLLGKYGLLYFGFTYCPDVCPAELSKMTRVIKTLEAGGLGDSIVPVFITIDPWRDTVEQVKSYIEEFHPRFKGLTGTPEQITKLAKYYRVFMSKAGKGDDYLVDHTIIVYLIGPDGKFIEFYNVNQDSDIISNKILSRIASGGKGGENKGEIQRVKSTFEKISEFLFKQ